MKLLKASLITAFLVLLAVDVLDFLSTWFGFLAGFREINPIGVFLINWLGVTDGLLIIKGLSLLIIGFTIHYALTTESVLDDEAALGALAFVDAIGVLVLSNNFSLLNWLH